MGNVTKACYWSNITFLPTQDVTKCLHGLPFNPDWRDGTVNALQKWLPNFVMEDSTTDSGPPADIRVSIQEELDKIAATEYENDAAMQSAFARLFISVHDGHTTYSKCDAYYHLGYTQPFKLKVAAVNEYQKVYLSGEARPGLLEHLGGDFASLEGLEILSIDGTAPVTEITNWAQLNVPQSSDQGVRFNIALFSNYFVSRHISLHDIPDAPVTYVLRSEQSPEMTIQVSLPWTAYNRGAPNPVEISVEVCESMSNDAPAPPPARPWQMTAHTVKAEVGAHTGWELVYTNHDNLGLYMSNDNTTGVIKLTSFSPNNYTEFCDAAQQSLAVLAERKSSNLVIDVLQNGGGYVCLGYNFLRLLVPEDLLDAPPSAYEGEYDLPWVPEVSKALRDSATARENFGLSGYIDATTGNLITEDADFYDGGKTSLVGDVPDSRRSGRFFLDCDDQSPPDYSCDLSQPATTFPKNKILVLSDGYCGSTCSTFMHRLQAGSYGKVAGVGGIMHVPMESNSFAGGFTSNIDNLNTVLQGSDRIPAFPTNRGVSGFAQAEVYDFARRDTPSQFAWSGTDYRFDFWDFSGDLGPLYDMAKQTFSQDILV